MLLLSLLPAPSQILIITDYQAAEAPARSTTDLACVGDNGCPEAL